MDLINIHQAKTNLSRLLSRVELGEEIIIANRGVPIAKLVPFRETSSRRSSLGQDKGLFTVPEEFNAPLPEDILTAFEGGNCEAFARYPMLAVVVFSARTLERGGN